MNPADQMIDELKQAARRRQRKRPITQEWLVAMQKIKVLEAQVARHPKWQLFIAFTAFLVGAGLGRAIP